MAKLPPEGLQIWRAPAVDECSVIGTSVYQERTLRSTSRNQIRDARGPCPSDHDLQKYRERCLDPSVSQELSQHLELCGMCQARVKRMVDIERALLERGSECPGWTSAKRRLRKRIRDIASGKEP